MIFINYLKMKSFSMSELGGFKIVSNNGETITYIARNDHSVYENLLESIRYISQVIAGKIENEEKNVLEFIDMGIQAINTAYTRLKEMKQ